jgi:hypothetical protein
MTAEGTALKGFHFNDDGRKALEQLLKSEWSKGPSIDLKQRATNSAKRKYFTELAIDDLQTVVGWELLRAKAPPPQRTKPRPSKRELEQIHDAMFRAIKKLDALNNFDSLFVDLQFDRGRRQQLHLELHNLYRALDKAMSLQRTGQKKKPYLWMALAVARWLLLFEIKPKKNGNMVEALEIVFTACGIESSSVRQAIENAWEHITQPEKTWPDFYSTPDD